MLKNLFKEFRHPKQVIKSETSEEENSSNPSSSEASVNFYDTTVTNSNFPSQIKIKMTSPIGFKTTLKRFLSGENLAEATLEELRQQFSEMKTALRTAEEKLARLNIQAQENPNPPALQPEVPTNNSRQPSRQPFVPNAPYILNNEDRKFIDNLLKNIMEFDGTQDVEAFKDDLRGLIDNIFNNSNSMEMKDALSEEAMRGVRARKLKSEAQRVATRIIPPLTVNKLSEALGIEFGSRGKNLSQLQQERNTMCQMLHEKVEHFIKRYQEMDRKIQRAIDYSPCDFKDFERRKEEQIRVKKFIDGLRNEISNKVATSKPSRLNDAYQQALQEEKDYLDREKERNRNFNQQQSRKSFKPMQRTQFRENPFRTPEPKKETNSANCNYCKKPGHDENKCYTKQNKERRENFQRGISQNKDPPRRTYLTEEAEMMDAYQKVINEDLQEYCSEEEIQEDILTLNADCKDTDYHEDFW